MTRNFTEYLGRLLALSSDEINQLSQLLELRSYDKKVRLTDLGEVEQYLNFVVKGLLRKYFYKGKDQIIKNIAPEGHVLASSVSFFNRQPSRYIVETIEPTVVASLSRDNLEKLFASSDRWERVGRLLMTEFLIEKEFWLLDHIRYTPRERFLRFMKEQPDLLQRVPQKYLASYLDIKPETFSRLKHLMYNKSN